MEGIINEKIINKLGDQESITSLLKRISSQSRERTNCCKASNSSKIYLCIQAVTGLKKERSYFISGEEGERNAAEKKMHI